MPLALQSCQAVKEECAAASSATDLTRVCGQQSQPPLWGCDTEISALEKHLLHLPSYLGRCGSCHVGPVHPTVPSTTGSTKPPWRSYQDCQLAASFAEGRDFSRLHLWKMILQPWSVFNKLLFVQH